MKRASANVNLTVVFVIINNIGMIDKGVCNKEFIWNPSSCECKCYKFCDFCEYLRLQKLRVQKQVSR